MMDLLRESARWMWMEVHPCRKKSFCWGIE
jgi:hypothetical protein